MYDMSEAEGIGISVMKPFSGGQMLNEVLSPFGKALTQYQCMQYALDRPGVLTVLPGVITVNLVPLELILGLSTSTMNWQETGILWRWRIMKV